MKKIISVLTLFFMICGMIPKAFAEKELNWYCKREKDHRTPDVPSELSFVYDYNAYSCDKNHTSYGDEEKIIYLTFDAGYENGNVEKTLDILKEEKVTAAFFVLGNLIERNTDLVKRMSEEGHLVCNHTYSHKNMSAESRESLISELKKLENVYNEKTGLCMPKFYRPPEGKFSLENLKALKDSGYKTIFWSFAYADWDNGKQPDREASLKKLKDNLHNGEIMLLHPTSDTNTAILSDFIKFARSEGFRFASLSEL
ncbi:MAG: polysaccharide deacetylase family protein [Clostridia bacterium]|nr:polysaccharide deacetylase family protein [Clostridia bacterium]